MKDQQDPTSRLPLDVSPLHYLHDKTTTTLLHTYIHTYIRTHTLDSIEVKYLYFLHMYARTYVCTYIIIVLALMWVLIKESLILHLETPLLSASLMSAQESIGIVWARKYVSTNEVSHVGNRDLVIQETRILDRRPSRT